MMEDGIIVLSDVDVIRLVRSQREAETTHEDQLRRRNSCVSILARAINTTVAAIRSDCASLQELGIAGATVFRGLEGFGESAENSSPSSNPQRSADCRYDRGHGGESRAADPRGRGDDGHGLDRNVGRGLRAHREGSGVGHASACRRSSAARPAEDFSGCVSSGIAAAKRGKFVAYRGGGLKGRLQARLPATRKAKETSAPAPRQHFRYLGQQHFGPDRLIQNDVRPQYLGGSQELAPERTRIAMIPTSGTRRRKKPESSRSLPAPHHQIGDYQLRRLCERQP